jgi:hypothetical protein
MELIAEWKRYWIPTLISRFAEARFGFSVQIRLNLLIALGMTMFGMSKHPPSRRITFYDSNIFAYSAKTFFPPGLGLSVRDMLRASIQVLQESTASLNAIS